MKGFEHQPKCPRKGCEQGKGRINDGWGTELRSCTGDEYEVRLEAGGGEKARAVVQVAEDEA